MVLPDAFFVFTGGVDSRWCRKGGVDFLPTTGRFVGPLFLGECVLPSFLEKQAVPDHDGWIPHGRRALGGHAFKVIHFCRWRVNGEITGFTQPIDKIEILKLYRVEGFVKRTVLFEKFRRYKKTGAD